VIGTPKPDEDLSFIKDEEAQRYVKCFRACEPIDLQEMYPAVESRGLELLKKMLKFSPNERISAEEALKDPYFDDIRLED
jgi:serine/threonine protein kinase